MLDTTKTYYAVKFPPLNGWNSQLVIPEEKLTEVLSLFMQLDAINKEYSGEISEIIPLTSEPITIDLIDPVKLETYLAKKMMGVT